MREPESRLIVAFSGFGGSWGGRAHKGVSAVGAPIRDSSGEVVASLSVVVPTDRFGPTVRESVTDAIRDTAIAIFRELGFKEESPG